MDEYRYDTTWAREPNVFLLGCSLKPRAILYKSIVNHAAMRSVGTHLATSVCEKLYHPRKDKIVSATPLPVLVNVEAKEAGTSKPSKQGTTSVNCSQHLISHNFDSRGEGVCVV